MPCYKPLKGFYSNKVNESGKRSLVFNVDQALFPVEVSVPCGRCIGCRLDRSLQWALRCVHEASLYEDNCFITLTFNDEFLNDKKSLKVADFQNFMKRLRQAILPRTVRFFHCGEYGAKFSRPHHHACLFGWDFPDKVLFKQVGTQKIFTSEMLSRLWPFGFSTVGQVTFESAAYVARYVMKKWSKDNLEGTDLYDAMCALSSDDSKKLYYGGLKEEYITMSRRPGIGQGWYEKFKGDIYPNGFCVVNGKKVKPPKYYDSKFELDNVFGSAMIKVDRLKRSLDDPNNSRYRLAVREEVKKCQISNLNRRYENEDAGF